MKLLDASERLCALEFPTCDEDAHPSLATVQQARGIVETALADNLFLVDCITQELALLRHDRSNDLTALNPFHTVKGLGIGLGFGYWPPNGETRPHEHTAWTITAVCRNELEVRTFDRGESYKRGELVPKNCFYAHARKVGFVYDPCIHAPRNTTDDWSLSLHIYSPRDGQPLSDYSGEILPDVRAASRRTAVEVQHPYLVTVAACQRQWCIHFLARILLTLAPTTPEAHASLAICAALGSTTTSRMIAQQLGPPGWEEPGYLIRRTDLSLDVQSRDGQAFLFVETPSGRSRVFSVSDLAVDALEYAVRNAAFPLEAMPGKLSAPEQIALADVLEETGIFKRVNAL